MADYIGAEAMLGEMWRRIKDYLTPDYRNAVEIGNKDSQLMKEGDTYTVPADGWIWYVWQNGSDDKYLAIDGALFKLSVNNSDFNGHPLMFQVTKGMVLEVPTQTEYPNVSASFAHSGTRLYFIPHRNAAQESVYISDNRISIAFKKGEIVKEEDEEWNSSSCSYEPAGTYTNYFYGTVTPYLSVTIKNPSKRTGQSIKSVEFTVEFSQLTFARYKGERKKYGRSFTRKCTVTPADGNKTYRKQLDPEENFEFLDWRGKEDWPDSSSTETWHINHWIGVTALVTLEDGSSFTLEKKDSEHTYCDMQGDIEKEFYWTGYISYSTKANV